MCGRYYVDDETSREIEKIVRKLDQRLKIEHRRTFKILSKNRDYFVYKLSFGRRRYSF